MCLFWLVSCGRPYIEVALVSTDTLNQDDQGSALPVVVRVYQLKSSERIEKADFMALWKSDRDFLKDDLIDRQELILQPNSQLNLRIEPDREASHLAMMALFRKPQGREWRQVVPLQDRKVRAVELRFGQSGIEIIRVD